MRHSKIRIFSKILVGMTIKDGENEPIKDISNRMKNVDVKLFIAQNKWDGKNKNGFEPIYEEYKEAFKM